MKEVYGDVWEYPVRYICITTNGDVRKNGAAVMGRGVALQAKQRFHGLDFRVGAVLSISGNRMFTFYVDWDRRTSEGKPIHIVTFPVKHHWYENADPILIEKSAQALKLFALSCPSDIFVLPRPGCDNGGLKWYQVKPILENVGLPDNIHVITLVNFSGKEKKETVNAIY